ncbi:MAG: UbiD family decarboxylase [Deltaproteobacteria bacterium]|nr:MAG: UbiD family decarboxylase [Deltaproteobacteria bacterium]
MRNSKISGRYIIGVGEDVDPITLQEVLWALCSRPDPEQDIDIIRRCWSTQVDPYIQKSSNAYFNSRAIVEGCKPYEWKEESPRESNVSLKLRERVTNKFKRIRQ